ncbi:A-kinase anchor protein 9 [Antennarius striatus]|uniref:A-kinase anchor protein 9 n=1 Tax=Antennarius striatus TaxID=241820 RepID=UPI0035B2CAED
MEDEERQKKLEAGKAKLAEYRQRKAYADSQKKQKKKKKKKTAEDSDGDSVGRVQVEPDQSMGSDEGLVGGRDGSQDGNKDPSTKEFTFTKTLKSGETVKHDQTYTIEPESEVSTTADDCSSEVNGCHDEMTENLMMSSKEFIWEDVEPLQKVSKRSDMQDMEKTQPLDELNQELEDIHAAFDTDEVQQLQDFEAALKQRDGIITQLTSNLQQARDEKDEIMKEFLELTEQSQKLQIQFQQLQAGETLRNTSHSSTAADLLQARQQLTQYQQQLEEMNIKSKLHREKSDEQLEHIIQLQHKINEMELMGRTDESLMQQINEKDLLVAEQEKTILSHEHSLTKLRIAEETFAQTLKEKNQLISEQTAIITEHELSLTLLRNELAHEGRTTDQKIMHQSDEQERINLERDRSLAQLENELESSKKLQFDLQQRMAAKESELERCMDELESNKSNLENCKSQLEDYKFELESERRQLESSKAELATSRQKERLSSNEIMQLMGTVEDLQKRYHQGNLSESDTIQKMQEETVWKLELLRAELDEMYGQQIVKMKQELNLQHAAKIEQITVKHHSELDLLKAQLLSESSAISTAEVNSLNAKIDELQDTLEQYQAMHNRAKHELNQVSEEKIYLQAKVDNLLQDLRSAKEKLEQVSHRVATQESQQCELLHLRESMDNLKKELAVSLEVAEEKEVKHDSEVTNYKIKLEMLEREKDAVLDRMAQSQEAELERLRTQLLFSHEEELISLREDLQRESFLNTENLLNEAAVNHERVLDELRMSYEETLHLLQRENATFTSERDELRQQIGRLKDELKLALHSSKSGELVQQLQELQVELEELRKGEEQAQEQEQCWIQSIKTLKEDLESKNLTIEALTEENGRIHQQLVELNEEIEKQKTTFSFAEKNFEVNYHELKEENDCLIETKTRLEDKILKETLEFEAKIVSLQSRIQDQEDSGGDVKVDERNTNVSPKSVIEKDTTELMEKLDVTLREKKSLAGRLSKATEQLMLTESKVGQLEEELVQVRQEKAKVIARAESLRNELDKKREQAKEQNVQRKLQQDEQAIEPICSFDDHHLRIQSLQAQTEPLQSLLQAAESERDRIRQTLELQRLSQTSSPAAAGQSSREGSVEGQSSQYKSTASGSSRRKRRQRSKQERKPGTAASDCRDEKQREEEEEAAAEEERATSAAESAIQPQMQSQVMSCSQERARKEDSTDGCQGDEGTDYSNKWVSRHGSGRYMEPVVCQGPEEEGQNTEHAECRLEMEAQRLSLSQIHTAQLELLQEEANATLHNLKDHDKPKIFQHQNILQAVSDECSEIIQCFQKIFGEDFFKGVHSEGQQLPARERTEMSESSSVVMEARALYRDLEQVREVIEQEHRRLSQLQLLLRTDGNKMMELQTALVQLKTSSEKEISDLRLQVASMSHSTGLVECVGAPSTCHTEELQRLRAEEQEKQHQLEERHRREVERLRDHYQQQAADTEERYLTELFMLQKRLQEVTGTHTHFSITESNPERMEAHTEEILKDLSKDKLSEGGVELQSPARSAGLTAQLQALRKALSHKYAQEVAVLKEQHNRELKRLREERLPGWNREEQEGRSIESLGAAGQDVGEDAQNWRRVEEEVAKAIVQMSVKFAQQTELVQINKRARQRCTSMQTQLDEDEVEEREKEKRTPRVPLATDAWLEDVERERLERGLEDRDAEIRNLKEELQRRELSAEQKTTEREEEEPGAQRAGRLKSPPQDDGDSERNVLRKANKKLRQVLVEVLKTTAAAEKTMGLHLKSLGASGGALHSSTPRTSEPLRRPAAGRSSESWRSGQPSAEDVSLWSEEAGVDEGLEMMENLLLGVGTQLENEEYLMGISSRLQTALEKMLMTITDTSNQFEHARLTQTELMRESFRHNQEMNELIQRQDDLQERLAEEAQERERLALELHRAEGVIDGYTDERAALEEQLRQKEEIQLSLEQELQVTGSRLHELEQEKLQMQEERELLSRQQDAMREDAGPRELRLVEAAMVAAPEADLLEETEKLMKEKVEVQRQAEKESSDLLKQVSLLEAELEEQVSRVMELEQTQRTESGDLQQQVQALEKQLEKNRKFLDEQAVDREHERDCFQQEIQKLERQLKTPQKQQTGSEERSREVDQLTSQLKEKADWCSELLLSSEQLRRDLGERDDEIDKLESRIRELEQALLASAESLEKVEQKKQHVSVTEAKHSTLESQLQTEREALERKEKEISNLEEQLEQFKDELENKSEEMQQLHMQLEIQRKEISSQQENLEDRDTILQVMEEKDREIAHLNEQITKLQHKEKPSDNKEMDGRDELIKDLESQVQCLRSEQERLRRNNEDELDQLNAVIDRLQQELANIERKQASEEYEDAKPENDGCEWGQSKKENDEMKQKMDLVTKELDTLKAEHAKLLETHLQMKQRTEAFAETEKLQTSKAELEEALREKTAGVVVMRAQIQALEQSATSRVEELDVRIRELEDLVDEKERELKRCRLLAEQTQSKSEGLQQKVSNLEKNLTEKVAAVLVSQATLEAFQQQHSQIHKENEDRQRRKETNVEPGAYDFHDFGIPPMDFSGIGQVRPVPRGKVVHLTDRLRELEVGLSGIQKDQELQKQLLSSSEEEVLEYEKRLSVLMDLLSQMKARTCQRVSPPVRVSPVDDQQVVSDVRGELQEVRDEVTSTEEQLDVYRDSCSRLQEELKEKTVSIEKLKDQLKQASSGGGDETKESDLHEELMEAQNEAAATKEELNSCRERLEKLQELLQEREMSIAHLKAELFQVKAEDDGADSEEVLQKVRKDAASTKEELNSFRQLNEQLQQDLHLRDVSINQLQGELQEMKQNADAIKEELDGYREQNEKLQDELRVHEVSVSELKEELREMKQNEDVTKEELEVYKEQNKKLQQDLQQREGSVSQVKGGLQEMGQEHKEKPQEELVRELNISQLHGEPDEKFQLREESISQLQRELQEMRQNADTIKEELNTYRKENKKLRDELYVREESISELQGELQEMRQNEEKTKEELGIYKEHNEKLQQDLQLCEGSISQLKGELQEMRGHVDSIKEDLNSSMEQNKNLQDEVSVRDVSISKLKEDLQDVQTALMKRADSVPPSPAPSPSPAPQPVLSSSSSSSTTQPKRKGSKQLASKGSSVKDKASLSRKSSAPSSQSNKSNSVRLNSGSEPHRPTATHSSTQTEPPPTADLGPEGESPTRDELEEMVGEFQDKIAQMQELHAAEILDMEARHISESEGLRRDTQALEDECKALKSVIDKLRSAKIISSRQDRPTSQFRDGYMSDSGSDFSQRPGFDLPSLQQELRTTPEGARRETDDPLPDRIKTLLREVHQEGMQVLSLSELPIGEGETGSQFNRQDWMKERDDFLAMVESLKGLISQMQMHWEAQTSRGEDWRVELLEAVRRVFVSERCVLKSALYSHLDQLDTSDAVVHLNQLERRLEEQDVQHREAVASLCAADRSSLVSEIRHLRGQLEQIHQGARPAASAGSENVLKERSDGGGGQGDRLLLEELKCELSQTKLELETTLKAQHKHLKELDTLRTEVSQKAAEVETLGDQLTEERKRSRDLQWAVEKEKCRSGREEESKREEFEDLQLTLEEEKIRVAQLTQTLEQERQASAQLSQRSEEERSSLHRRLQELQVQLESEQGKSAEMSTALERERDLRMITSPDGGPTNSDTKEEASLLERLQRELDDKHLQVVHLLSQVASQKLEVLRKEEEHSKRDREALLEAQVQLRRLEDRLAETQEQLEGEMDGRKRLEEEKERLEERLNQSEERRTDGQAQAAWHGDSTDRTKDWVFQQKSGSVQASYPLLEASLTGPVGGPHQGPWRTLDRILENLHLVSSKVRALVSRTSGRSTAEVDSEDLSWLQSSIDEVIALLQQSPGLPAAPESVSLTAAGASNSLTERLLKQNAELTGFVSRLTEEKNDLRNHNLRLEEEVRRYQNAAIGSGGGFSSRRGVTKEPPSGTLLSQEQEAWGRERTRLERALHVSQAQVARLRADIRSDMLREITGPGAGNAALKKMYGKFMRSESFRKALIYQKKYLLLLLGGFQECEEATLSLLCRMGGRPSSVEYHSQQYRRGLTRFRSAVRVSIALSRMRFLVRRWHRVTGLSAETSGSSKDGAGPTFGTDVRDSPYLQPGGGEMYRERASGGGGASSSRGRSGHESPRSGVSSSHHRFHVAGDHGPLTCSHLQSYDPDRALTDYISRLEALQRRLGTVTSGASSHTQLHFGLRR